MGKIAFSFFNLSFLDLSAFRLVPHRASAQAAAAATPTTSGEAHFIEVALSSNTFGDYTLLDNIATNNLPNASLFVTPNVTPFAVSHLSDPHPVGVWYDSGVNEWAILNDDGPACRSQPPSTSSLSQANREGPVPWRREQSRLVWLSAPGVFGSLIRFLDQRTCV